MAQKLSTKPNLLNKVRNMLPEGTDLNAATAGFKNFGQFLAACNVSHNLGIEFADLKAAMTGINMDGTLALSTVEGTSTAQSPMSLGQAIQQLKNGVDATAEAQAAETQANRDISSDATTSSGSTSGSTSTPTTTTSTKSKVQSKPKKRTGSTTSPTGGSV